MSRIFAPKDGEVYGFKFTQAPPEAPDLWIYDPNPLNNSVKPLAAGHYKSDYKLINNCVLNKNPQLPNQTLYDIVGMHFQKNLIGDIAARISERTYLPLYYIKMDGYKQLLYKLKSCNFMRDLKDPSAETYLVLPRLIHTPYTDEYQYYRDNQQLNCSLIFQKEGFGYMYDIERDVYPNLRVSEPILSEIIFFV